MITKLKASYSIFSIYKQRLYLQESKSNTVYLFTTHFFFFVFNFNFTQMDLHFFVFFHKIFFFLTIFTHLILQSFSLSSNSTSCSPQNCGNGPNITFPFFIPQQQESSCGSRGFNITCKNNHPVIKISDDDYIVKDIFYSNNSLLIVSSKAFNTTNNCPIPLKNFTTNGTPFSYSDLTIDLHFFYNCSQPYLEKTYTVNCGTNSTQFSSFAVFHPEILEKRNYSIDLCQSLVHVPVHTDSMNALLYESYNDVLRKGFILDWQCSNCEQSGIFHRFFSPTRNFFISISNFEIRICSI